MLIFITHSIEDIQKAIEGSKILALSSDKQNVRRTTEIQKKDDIDEYMVYVVCLMFIPTKIMQTPFQNK